MPAPVPEGLKTVAARALMDLDHELMPAQREWISARIMTLLAHYWTPAMPENLQAAVGRDWIEILSDYPRQAIDRACIDYLSTEPSRRPVPAAIRKLCHELAGDRLRLRDRLKACMEIAVTKKPYVPPTAAEKARASELVEEARRKLQASMTDEERAADK